MEKYMNIQNEIATNGDVINAKWPLSGWLIFRIENGDCHFSDSEKDENGLYQIEVARIFRTAQSLIDFIAHMQEKDWFDAAKFCETAREFRDQNHIYGQF